MKKNWIIAFFVLLTNSSTKLRKILWHWVYNNIALKDTSGSFLFMNYGYQDDHEAPISLEEVEEPHRPYIQLYDHVVKGLELKNKKIIEVGCGRGGGGQYLLRYKNPELYTGVDLSEKAIEWCQKRFPFPSATWVQGSADALPFADNSIDVVINVESSHCYPSMEKFLSEVKRVLKPNGYMAYCDMRPHQGIESLKIALENSGLKILRHQDITLQVLGGLNQTSKKRDAEIISVFPRFFHRTVRDFAGVKDTAIYNMLKKGEMQYFSYLLQKNM